MLVYFHRNPVTYEIFYVGIGSENGRAQRPHKRDNRNKYWHHTVKKYGGFIVQIVTENLSVEQAREKEMFYILLLGKKINGGQLVNLADGGETNAGYKWTDKQRETVTKRAKEDGNVRLQAPEIRAKAAKTMSIKLKGRFKGKENSNFGNRWTDEMKSNMSKKKREYYSKIPSRKKVYQKLPEDVRKKIICDAMIESWGRKVVCTKTGIIYKTIVDAANSIGMNQVTLRYKLNGINPNNTSFEYLNPIRVKRYGPDD